jgi:hypothetical protein
LELKSDKLLSSFASKFNLRRYTLGLYQYSIETKSGPVQKEAVLSEAGAYTRSLFSST